MVSKDEEMTSLCIGISQILHRRRLVEIPHSSEACVKMLNKLLELTNTPSASLRKQASELLATLIYTYSLIEVDSDDYYPSRDSVKLSSVTATEDISPALLDFIICPLKQIWRSADDSNNPYIRHTIIMTYISLFHMYDQQILMKNLFDLIKMALELLEAKPYSENDENFEYVCHLGKILTYSAFIKNNSLDIKKYILDILIRRFLMVWVNPESKTDDIPTSSVAKVCILWTVSALLPTIEFSDIFEDPDFSNTIIELISATPLQHLPHVLRCANSICMHSPKSSVKMFCTLAVMAEQEFTMTLAPKYSCENLRKYSIAVSAILPNVCGRSEYLSQKVIYSLLKMGLSLVSTDVSKVTGQKAAISVKSGLSIIAGLSHSHLKYVMSSMKTLISSMESLSTIYTCDDMLDDLTMRGVLDVRISILDVLHRLFKNHQMLSSSVLKSINTIFGRAIDLASHMLNNYKQLLSSRSYVKPDIISLLNSFLKRLLISPHLDVLGCEWNYKLMYLSYRLICIQHEKDYPIKKKLNILKRSWKPNCSSLYLNIIDKYLLLSLQHQQPLSRQLSSQQQSNTNWSSQTTSSSQITLDICKPIVEFAFDPFCIKHWFYDFSIVDDSRAFTAIDDLLRDSINEGTLKDNNILKPPGPPGYTLVVDNAILVLSSALSMSGEFITDFLSKLRKSFCLEAKSERSEKVMNVNRMNIVVCLYYMLEHAQKNSIEVTDSYIDIILGILIKALACPDSTICLVSCQALRLLFTLPGTENVLQSTLESVIEEAKPNVASLALACMFSGTKVQDDIAYAHKISGYVVHKLSICDSDDIMWHLHSLSLIMRTSIVPLVPYLEDILMRVRGLYLSDSSSLYFRVSLTSLAKACLIIPLSVGSILESIIHFANSQLNASPELLSNISDVLGCMRIDETPFAAIKAMRCARLLLDFPDLVNPSAEIAYLVRMLGEKNGELCSLIKETAIECLFDIVKSKKYTSDRNLSSPSVLIKFIHAVDQDLDQVVLRKLHDIVIELIKINIDKAPVILVGMCKSILLDDKKCTEDYEQAYMSQNLMSSSSTVREEYFSSIASSDNARQHSPRKRSLTPSVDPASADYSALLLRYLPPDSDHPCTPGLEVRAHTLYYLRRSMELAADDDDSRPDNSHPPKFSYVRHGALIKSIGDIIKMGCYGANSGHRVICIESHKLLYTVLKVSYFGKHVKVDEQISISNSLPRFFYENNIKYFSNITYPGVYNDVTLIDSYQSQILAVVRKTLALDSNLKLNVLSFKILFMQAMNSSYDTSLIYNGINTLVTESLIRLGMLIFSAYDLCV